MKESKISYEFGNGSDVGCVRTKNEDKFVLYTAPKKNQKYEKGHLLLVCDGMGGARGGQVASAMATEEIGSVYYKIKTKDIRHALAEAISSANAKIFSRSSVEPDLKGMGTTVVAVSLIDDKAYVAHIGDSRCYLIRNKEISRSTEDHTMVQKMVNDGLISLDQARNHPDGHILNRSVGVGKEVEVEVQQNPYQLQPGDIIVMCSDGLSGQVLDDEILQVAVANPAQRAVEKLINLAKERGGADNITIQIVRIHGDSSASNIDTTLIRQAPLKLKKGWVKILLITILLLLIASGVIATLWFYELVDFKSLLNLDWLPSPPKEFPPFK